MAIFTKVMCDVKQCTSELDFDSEWKQAEIETLDMGWDYILVKRFNAILCCTHCIPFINFLNSLKVGDRVAAKEAANDEARKGFKVKSINKQKENVVIEVKGKERIIDRDEYMIWDFIKVNDNE